MKLPITLSTTLHAKLLAEARVTGKSLNHVITEALTEHVEQVRKPGLNKDAWLDIGRTTVEAALKAVTSRIGGGK